MNPEDYIKKRIAKTNFTLQLNLTYDEILKNLLPNNDEQLKKNKSLLLNQLEKNPVLAFKTYLLRVEHEYEEKENEIEDPDLSDEEYEKACREWGILSVIVSVVEKCCKRDGEYVQLRDWVISKVIEELKKIE